jgi:L-lactate permease
MPCIGVTTNTSDVSADADIEVMMLGLIRHDSFADFGAAGAPVYVSAGASGVLTTTAPSGTDDVVQVVGHAIAEDLIFVQPCLTTIEHA